MQTFLLKVVSNIFVFFISELVLLIAILMYMFIDKTLHNNALLEYIVVMG